MPVIARYAATTVPPLLLLLLASTVWGGFAWIALAWLTIVATLADKLLEPPRRPASDEVTQPWSDALSGGLAAGHFLVLISTCAALSAVSLTFWQGIALFFATASFFGQVSHPNAHELIHRPNTLFKALGAAVYSSVGFGHHVSAHRLVHHRHVGTEEDPNTPLPGESFWTYLPRAWRGSFEAGIEQEVERLEKKGRGPNHITNPYWLWLGGTLVTAIIIAFWAGLGGILMLISLGALTGMQILMSDYVQHYGLQRLILSNGRTEPVAPHHSWNAPKGFSSYLMMNAPAHSEHHMHPDRPYERLDPQSAPVPTLPFSMPIMAMIALVPSAWHRMMDPRALKVMEAAQTAHLAPKPAAPPAPAPSPAPAAVAAAAPTGPAPQPAPAPSPPPSPAPAPATAPAQTRPSEATVEATAPAPIPAPENAAPNTPVTPKNPAPKAEPLSDDPETEAMLQAIRAATR